MLVIWLATTELPRTIEWFQLPGNPARGTGIIIAGSAIALIFNFANYYLILTTSALTAGVGSCAIKIVLLIMTSLTDHIHDGLTIGGVCLGVLSIGAYTYFIHLENTPPPRAADRP